MLGLLCAFVIFWVIGYRVRLPVVRALSLVIESGIKGLKDYWGTWFVLTEPQLHSYEGSLIKVRTVVGYQYTE